MARFKFSRALAALAALIVLAALALFLERDYEAQRRLRSQGDELRDQLNRLTQLEVENIRLSNIVAQTEGPLDEAQLAELRKLRFEVEALRRQTNQIQTLRAEINRLRAALSNARTSIAGAAPPDVPAEDVYPRELWAYAGNDTPEDALESLAWAISVGDQDTYLSGLTPDLRDQMQTELADTSFADEGPFEMGDTSGFRILDREITSENQVLYTLYMDGEEDTMPVVLEFINGQWLVASVNQ